MDSLCVDTLQVGLVASDGELEAAADVLLQLRSFLTRGQILIRIRQQMSAGYQLAIATRNNRVIAVAGFVVVRKLAWGKHIYVDDLVTSADCRSGGAGKALIDWLKAFGREQGCEQLHLDSGVERFAAHRFYLREGFAITSHHFALSL
ncbi:GNAT family N-acetyltransferase [Microbulbifer sp. TYP-18]|uniref:GNAT family N-acetyltransferase n=1 Tax=Microbulbifer sp. TYP-18 TaxID=3230024 RepID=UPI0034C5FA95